jgi:hypothetical protein
MAYSVAYQHTDSNRDHDGSDVVYGVKKVGTDRNLLVPYSIKLNRRLNVFLTHPGNKKRTQSSRLDAQPKNKFNH